MKKRDGITIISLVISIVVMIILASIVITMSFNKEGLLDSAVQVKKDLIKEEMIEDISRYYHSKLLEAYDYSSAYNKNALLSDIQNNETLNSEYILKGEKIVSRKDQSVYITYEDIVKEVEDLEEGIHNYTPITRKFDK